jgi:ribosomal protein S12 methylthiotransferase accessory factor
MCIPDGHSRLITSLQSRGSSPSLENAIIDARQLVDRRLGIVRTLHRLTNRPGEPAFPHYAAELARIDRVISAPGFSPHAGGSALDPRVAEMRALGEAIERYCAFYRPDAPTRHASFDELGVPALDPMTLPRCSPAEYAAHDNALRPPSRDMSLDWTHGYSFASRHACLLPADLVYLTSRRGPTGEVMSHPISTGLAAGRSLAEATVSGLCEVIERDALTLVWYNQLPVPLVAMESVDSVALSRRLALLADARLEITVCSLTLDVPVAVIMVILKSRDLTKPAVTVATACHAEPLAALLKAIDEAVATRAFLLSRILAGARVPEAPRDVVSLEDHALFYAEPETVRHFAFLFESSTQRRLDDLPSLPTDSPGSTLTAIVDALATSGFHAYAADITTSDVRGVGFAVVRALVPGLEPLSISHRVRYLGRARSFTVAKDLGYDTRTRTAADITTLPHPFA